MNSPELSVILLVPDSYGSVKNTIEHLRQQTARGRLEVVLVTANALDSREVNPDLETFFPFRIVPNRFQSVGSGYAAGIRNASAPLVALAEDHSFPEPEWAEVLIQAHAHAQEAAVIGPAVKNANPDSLVSWADLLIAYSPWLDPAQPKEMPHLPGHNSSYKREVLQQYDDELAFLFEAETVLHWKLRRQGYRLLLEPRARTRHTNFERILTWTVAQFYSGRRFAASRAMVGQWFFSRLLYACGSPLIPLVRFARIAAAITHERRLLIPWWSSLPLVGFGLIVDAAGQFCGYLAGAGKAQEKLRDLEFNRDRHRKNG